MRCSLISGFYSALKTNESVFKAPPQRGGLPGNAAARRHVVLLTSASAALVLAAN